METMNLSKIALCKNCGKKPKEEIVAFSYGDSNDELFLVHWCKGIHIRFPDHKTNPFTAYYVNGQRPRVRDAWNLEQDRPHTPKP